MNSAQLQQPGRPPRRSRRTGDRGALIGNASWAQEPDAIGAGKLHQKTRAQPGLDNEIRANGKETHNMAKHMDAKGA
eukprot:8392880-Pyramimonas_sp.AAC.1